MEFVYNECVVMVVVVVEFIAFQSSIRCAHSHAQLTITENCI